MGLTPTSAFWHTSTSTPIPEEAQCAYRPDDRWVDISGHACNLSALERTWQMPPGAILAPTGASVFVGGRAYDLV